MAMVLHGTTPAAAQTFLPAPAAPAPQASRAFAGLFRDTVTDFRGLASRDHLTVLAVGALVATAAHGMDRQTTTTLSSPRAGFLAGGETIGSARFQLGGALAAFAVGHAIGNAKIAAVGADLVRANIVSQTLTGAVKFTARRERPDGTGFSFPSGHTAVTFASATVLQRHLGWKAGVPAYAVASYVAASRIHDKRHFLSDVAFGAAVGVVSGWTVTMGHGKTRVAISPIATPGGGGIGFTWTGQ
jgi:membrane-associated phospholipid phosphatase